MSDISLPGGIDGLSLVVTLRERLGSSVPVVMLSADSSAQTLETAARLGFAYLGKPARPGDVLALVHRLLPQLTPEGAPMETATPGHAVIHLVEAETPVRAALRRVLESAGWQTRAHQTAEDFLRSYTPADEACLLLDANLPDMSGFDLLKPLRTQGDTIPVLMLTGFSDVTAAVAAMRAGASDFMEKPVRRPALLAGVAQAMEQARDVGKRAAWRQEAAARISLLTPRQRDVMDRVLAGEPSKNIATDLWISQRTVESHRAEVMHVPAHARCPPWRACPWRPPRSRREALRRFRPFLGSADRPRAHPTGPAPVPWRRSASLAELHLATVRVSLWVFQR